MSNKRQGEFQISLKIKVTLVQSGLRLVFHDAEIRSGTREPITAIEPKES